MELNDRQIVELACKTLAEKKAVDIKIIEVVGMTDITDYFIVCSGRSMPQVKALCENLEEKMEENGVFARRKEGAETRTVDCHRLPQRGRAYFSSRNARVLSARQAVEQRQQRSRLRRMIGFNVFCG